MTVIGLYDKIPTPKGLNETLRVGTGTFALLYVSSDVSRRSEEPRYEFKHVGYYNE